jgi:hypothetical protein
VPPPVVADASSPREPASARIDPVVSRERHP